MNQCASCKIRRGVLILRWLAAVCYRTCKKIGHSSKKCINFAKLLSPTALSDPSWKRSGCGDSDNAKGILPLSWVSKSPKLHTWGMTVKDAHFLDISKIWMECLHSYRNHIRTWGTVFSSLKEGVWRYLILKDVMQNSLTSLAYIEVSAVRPQGFYSITL